MTTIIYTKDIARDLVDYADDIRKLRAALNNRGLDMEPACIARAYSDYTQETLCAGWIHVGDAGAAKFAEFVHGGFVHKWEEEDDNA